jgi:hypothetical protein
MKFATILEDFEKSVSSHLDPCPFCGCTIPYVNLGVKEKGWIDPMVFCPKCMVGVKIGSIGVGCGMEFIIYKTLSVWNRRGEEKPDVTQLAVDLVKNSKLGEKE